MSASLTAMRDIFSIGHSNHPIVHFLGLLARHDIAALADVRSTPYSRFNPQFNRETLAEHLPTALRADRMLAQLHSSHQLRTDAVFCLLTNESAGNQNSD